MRSLGTQFCFSDVHLGAECWSYRGRGEGDDALIIISDNKPTGLLFSFVCCLEFTTILKMTWSWGYILHTWRYAAGYEETLGVCKDFRENGEIVDGFKWLCSVHSTMKKTYLFGIASRPPKIFGSLSFSTRWILTPSTTLPRTSAFTKILPTSLSSQVKT